jgi:hypothetical protein
MPFRRPKLVPTAALDCAGALSALPKLFSGELERAQQRSLRAHLNACATCKAEYVSQSHTAGAIARDGRVGRAEAERVARRRRLAALARAGHEPRPRIWVRTLVVPAFLIVLLARQQPQEVAARVEAQLGSYRLGERTLAAEHKPQRVQRGDQLHTDESGLLRVFDGDAELRLAGAGSLVVESPAQRRYLLGVGQFEARGAHVFTTRWGVFELGAGELELELGASGGRVLLRSGAAEFVRASGACLLEPGEPLELGAGL